MKRLVALLLLSACGSNAAEAENRIECALDGSAAFERVCTVERSDGLVTVRSPSGSFRRLVATADGSGVMAADGAEAATVKAVEGNVLEVSIGADRYRLPPGTR